MADVDLLAVGRVNLDLYAQQAGLRFADVAGWDAMVGGSPANAALAAARLGVRAGLLSAVGDDLVGDWVLSALEREGVDTEFVTCKRGPHTSLALRAQVPPDHPLAFFRHDPADIHVTVGDTLRVPVERTRAVLISADALARGPMVLASLSILFRALSSRRPTYFDLDLRHVNWPDPGAYADAVSTVVDDVDVLLGTEDEFAALLRHPSDFDAEGIASEVRTLQSQGPDRRVMVLKQGSAGVTVFCGSDPIDLPAYPVEEASTVGAGDSFAGGLIAARLEGLSWERAARFASACAAITVSRLGCSAGFPRRAEVEEFLSNAAAGSHAR